ncbi:MAG: hypothetical protein KDC52_03010 [Ignavibacteriae bacterium]|nr:hypothetical protein [Ignavibacteriota bacterium]
MNKNILILILAMGIFNNLFAQKNTVKFKLYNNTEKKYAIEYPENWQVKINNEGVVSIESDDIKGGIYISLYNGITFSDEHMETFILESNNLPDNFRENVLSGTENGIKSWYVSYTDSENNLTCMSMYKRKGDKLWFVSTEIEPELWNNGWKDIIVKILISFKINAT